MKQPSSRETDARIKYCQEIAVIGALIGIQSDELGEDVKEWILQTLSVIKQGLSASMVPCYFINNNPPRVDTDLEPIPVGNRILVLTGVLVIARALDYMTLSIKTYCPEF